MSLNYQLGIDVGGTFTDFFLWSSDGTVSTHKTLSTPQDPSVAVLTGLAEIAEQQDLGISEFAARISTIVHGTTVTTNATLTRSGARTGLLTTEGVRDALEMRRGIREKQYDNRFTNVPPLVPRYLRIPVRGRLDYRGAEIEPLDVEGVREAARVFADEGVEAVAVCFMNSFADPTHEKAAAEILAAELPDVFLSTSTEVLPTIRFYNRVSTTVLNSYVGPILRDYLESLTTKLSEAGFTGILLIMQSNGGVARPNVAVGRPAATLLSGPAGGPRAAVGYTGSGGNEGDGDCIVVDMGGTSFDASLVRNGEAAMYQESDIERLRIALPMLAIITIGAGGGSIGWIDEGGLLRMGPQSAGADPGPACYGRGGERPTCTDANVVLGYLDPDFFAGGAMSLDADAARKAVAREVGDPLGLSPQEAAAGMFRVINTNMAHGVREITVERGLDPRDFPIVVAGGAGALHACMIAEELEIPRLVIPPTASVLCAVGMLQSDLQHDFVRSYVTGFDDLDPERLRSLVKAMAAEGDAQLALEGVAPDRIEHRVDLDLRYVKQYHEVTVPIGLDSVENGDVATIAASFHREHNRLYGYDLAREGTEVELINVRVRAIGRTAKPELPRLPRGEPDPSGALKGVRSAHVPGTGGFADLNVYDGHRLRAGNRVEGPALIERTDTTILVSSSFDALIDENGSCLLNAKEG